MRNAVKATVDAYDGTVTLYVADPDDPLIEAWGRAFPGILTPLSEAPARAARSTSATPRTSSACSARC